MLLEIGSWDKSVNTMATGNLFYVIITYLCPNFKYRAVLLKISEL